jgi:hypothetical protein
VSDICYNLNHLSPSGLSARSGFSFIPTAEGVILHGGYVKEYVKGKRVEGKALEDTWLLQYVGHTYAVQREIIRAD